MENKDVIYRENRKIKKLVNEYRQKGYKVIVSPKKNLLPLSLNDYEPDLLLKKDKENIVIEVKTSESLRKSAYLKDLAEKLNSLENWKFELVLTNPRNKFIDEKSELEEYSIEELKQKLTQVKKTIDYEFPEPHLLYTWSLFEAAARTILKKEQPKVEVKLNTITIIKQLYSYGIINSAEYDWLNSLLELENKLSHGYKVKSIAKKELEKLIKMIEEFIKKSQ